MTICQEDAQALHANMTLQRPCIFLELRSTHLKGSSLQIQCKESEPCFLYPTASAVLEVLGTFLKLQQKKENMERVTSEPSTFGRSNSTPLLRRVRCVYHQTRLSLNSTPTLVCTKCSTCQQPLRSTGNQLRNFLHPCQSMFVFQRFCGPHGPSTDSRNFLQTPKNVMRQRLQEDA